MSKLAAVGRRLVSPWRRKRSYNLCLRRKLVRGGVRWRGPPGRESGCHSRLAGRLRPAIGKRAEMGQVPKVVDGIFPNMHGVGIQT